MTSRFYKLNLFFVLLIFMMVIFSTVMEFEDLSLYQNNDTIQVELGYNNTEENKHISLLKETSQTLHTQSGICSHLDECHISCVDKDLMNILESIEETMKNSTCWSLRITMEGTSLGEKVFFKGWLQKVNLEVSYIQLSMTAFDIIGESPFFGKPFNNPLTLILSNTNLRVLSKSFFKNSKLLSFEMVFDAIPNNLCIEEDIFNSSSSTIQSIAFKHSLDNSEALMNVTGRGSILVGLQSLDLSFNSFNELRNGMFSRVPFLVSLYLASNGVKVIEKGSFDGLSRIIQLDLTNNELKTLPSSLFHDLSSVRSLFISGNPWRCDCDLEWFKNYLMTIPAIGYRRCKFDSTWIDMDNVDFCPANLTDSTSSHPPTERTVKSATTDSTLITDMPDGGHIYDKIKCRNLLSIHTNVENLIIWNEIIFKKRNLTYVFSEIQDRPVFILKFVHGLNSKDHLIWTNVDDHTDHGCVYNISSQVIMTFNFAAKYLLCFYNSDSEDDYVFMADDCSAIITPPQWSQRTWITNGKKTIIVTSGIFIFILTIVSTAGIVYITLKYSLINYHECDRHLGPHAAKINCKTRHISLCSTDSDGYLDPKLENWINSKVGSKYQALNIISDQLMYLEDYVKNFYEPPPLPPNHPLERRDSGKPYFYSNM